MGYWDGTVPANIHAELMEEKLPKTQQIQSVGRQCTNSILFSENEKLRLLKLQVVTNERSSISQTMHIFLKRKKLHTGISL